MLAANARRKAKAPVGSPLPRIAPPTPVKADLTEYVSIAKTIGLELFPWQQTAGRFITAKNAKGLPLYREVAVIVGRQNGKTRLAMPLVIQRLLEGRRVIHAAQHLRLPGEFHEELAGYIEDHYSELIPSKRGISWRAGQESIRLTTGGYYSIVAGDGKAPRGPSNDLILIDELREFESDRLLAAVRPTTLAKPHGQFVYLSNAGHSDSVVLNGLKARAGNDPNIAYLEWSAAPEYAADDVAGWLQANPAIGHIEGMLENLQSEYQANLLAGTMANFETENLCRWVVAMERRLVPEDAWADQEFLDEPGNPVRAAMGISMDISGERASAVIAWVDRDEHVTLDVHDTQGSPIDVTVLGPDIQKLGTSNRVVDTAYDPYTDVDLVRYIRKAKAIRGVDYGNASEKFVRLVTERKLRIHDPKGVLTEDLRWTTRRPAPNKTYMAVRANDEHSNTAVLAAIRATWLATNPDLHPPLRMH